MSVRHWRFGDDEAVVRSVVERGGILLFPTESSYAVGVDPRSQSAVEAVYRLKERERGKPLGVVVADPDQAIGLGVRADDPAFRWACRYWPAALSVLVTVERRLPAMGDAELLSVRVPDHAGLRGLLAAVGPLTATSANSAGHTPIVDPGEASSWVSRCLSCMSTSGVGTVDCVTVDAGVLPGGAPSTVVSWVVLPPGGGRPEMIRAGRFPWPARPAPSDGT